MRAAIAACLSALVLAGVLVFPDMASAQASGTLTGVVRDKGGAVVPGATVEVASAALGGRIRTTVAGVRGEYRVSDLLQGLYSATFFKAGFVAVTRMGVDITGGATTTLDAELGVAPPIESRGFTARRWGVAPFAVPFGGPADSLSGAFTARSSRPKVLCGLTMLPIDPRVDAKMRLPGIAPGVIPSARTITPELCRD